MIDDHDLKVSEYASNVLILFFKTVNPNNRTAKNDLILELTKANINKNTATRLLMQIDADLIHDYTRILQQNSFVNAGSTKITAAGSAKSIAERPKSRLSYNNSTANGTGTGTGTGTGYRKSICNLREAASAQGAPTIAHHSSLESAAQPAHSRLSLPKDTDPTDELMKLFTSLPGYQTDESINPIDVISSDNLEERFESMLPIFEGRETEFNWTGREKYIIQMRSILRGNAVSEYPTTLSQCFKSVKECVCKSISSLRTTFSNHGCQLAKELGIELGQYLEPGVVETLVGSLIKLAAARKPISNQNSNVAIISLLINSNFNSRVFHQIYVASQDKNAQTRAYSAAWLNVLLIKYRTNKAVLENQTTLEMLEKSITKGVADPTPAARESMRVAYWSLYDMLPTLADNIMRKLDANVAKALERTRPSSSPPSSASSIHSAPSSRLSYKPSMKELVMAKQREQQTKSLPQQHQLRQPQQKQQQQQHQHHQLSLTENRPIHRSVSDPKPRITKTLRSISGVSTVRSTSLTSTRSSTQETKVDEPPLKVEETKIVPSKEDVYESKKDVMMTDAKPVVDEHTEKLKATNLVFRLLTSDDKSEQQRGFDLLLKRNDTEPLNIKFNSVLNKLSSTNPTLFEPIFENINHLQVFIKFLSTDNLIRLICIYDLKHSLNSEILSTLKAKIPIDDICFSIINILGLSVDASRSDDINISMQFVRNKTKFLNTCFVLLEQLMKDTKLESYLIGAIFEASFKCWEVIEDEPEPFLLFMKMGLNLHEENFKRCLMTCDDPIMMKVLSEKLNINPSSTSRNQSDDVESSENAYMPNDMSDDTTELPPGIDGLTMIVGKKFDNLTNIKSDMTMIMPNFKKQLQNDQKLQLDQIGEEEYEQLEESKVENPFMESKSDDSKLNDYKIDDVFKDRSEDDKMEVDISTHEEAPVHMMSDTTPNLDHLNLSDHSKLIEQPESIQAPQPFFSPPKSSKELDSILECNDPLSSLTKSADRIVIYEDDGELNELNSWFDFEMTKFRSIRTDTVIDDEESLLNKLSETASDVNNQYLLKLVNYYESGQSGGNTKRLQNSIISYLNASLDIESILMGLILIRTCIVSNGGYEMEIIFNKLIELSSSIVREDDELYFAISETFSLIDKLDLYVDTLCDNKKLSGITQQLLLSNLFNLINPDSLSPERIFKMEWFLFKLVNSKLTSVRRLVILIYGIFMNYKKRDLKDGSGAELIDNMVFEKLNSAQLKLVDLYSDRF
ncbi:hypothetical protein CANARDRAFT_29488 [[Candida] arabinofermentans NRRL YB-2248]|uniref:Protein STU1 n=1 Tax=[Candida] arabinofermentans NRRL YB-2248 TaxID=983967 RepID=A0A1E4SX21_9ASCO|nr:hypothetical protein CANARDRAFT_29488 [[Candida] arabinofermentans NRRL YB-2248]